MYDIELFEFHERILKRTKRVKKELSEQIELTKSMEKSFLIIIENLETYEVSYDTLNGVSEVLNKVMNEKEQSTIERELKTFADNFWK